MDSRWEAVSIERALVGCVLVSTALLIGAEGLEAGDGVYVPKRLALGVFALMLALHGGLSRREPPGISAPVLAWAGMILVGLVSTMAGTASLQLGLERIAAEASALIIAVVTARLARDAPERDRLVALLTGVAVVVAAVALLEALGLELPWVDLRRPASTLGGRNQVAGFVGLILPLAIARFARGKGIAWGASTVLLVIIVVLTRCRSVWLGLGIAVVLAGFGLLRGPMGADLRTRLSRVLLLLVLAVGLAVLVPWPGLRWQESSPFAASLMRIAEHDQGSGRYRVGQAMVTRSIVASAPLLGMGPTAWTDASSRFAHEAGLHPPPYGDGRAPRSDLLRILAETGLLGLTAWGAFSWTVARRVRAATVPGLGAALTVFGVHAVFDQPLLHAEQLAAGGVLVGLAMAEGTPCVFTSSVRRKAFVILALLIAGGTWCLGRYYLIATLGPRQALVATAHVEALSRAALRLSRSRDCVAAAPLLDRAIAEAPHLVGLLCVAARCAESRGDLPSALAFARRADAVEPHLASRLQGSTHHDCGTVLRLLETASSANP
ncbi:O-antigen ligase family protein [Corallococcus sp. AS-1-6]|uniref:O-antigen ligase family protein n=1 Tax=Corallococcus TaxID=83461 RepID=UPI001CBDCA32|nr:O-antigen ligase family protein [Corallococcus sp. AS-1-6]MBZ4373755.1 O-antigen ligase family protein [Corallococcus sp. AS-1-6]